MEHWSEHVKMSGFQAAEMGPKMMLPACNMRQEAQP